MAEGVKLGNAGCKGRNRKLDKGMVVYGWRNGKGNVTLEGRLMGKKRMQGIKELVENGEVQSFFIGEFGNRRESK